MIERAGRTPSRTGAAVKKQQMIALLVCVLAGGGVGAPALGEELYPQPASAVQRARGDADAAHRREADLADQIAAQERVNQTLRDQLRRVDADPTTLQKDLVDASE